MRLMYMDEAGIGHPRDEPFTVVAGVLIHGDSQLTAVEDGIATIVAKHIPPGTRPGFVISAKELFNGGRTLKREDGWNTGRAMALAHDLTSLIQRTDLTVTVASVERKTLPDFGMFRHESEAAHAAAFAMCVHRCEDWMRHRHQAENVLMVVEDTSNATALRKLIRQHQDPLFVSQLEIGNLPLPLRHVRHDPLFQSKSPNSPLVLADYCAYIWKRYLADKPLSKEVLFPMLNRFYTAHN